MQCQLHMDDPTQEGLTRDLADRAIDILSQDALNNRHGRTTAEDCTLLASNLPTHTGRVHVFILAGQSNMAGRADASTLAVDCASLSESVRMCWCNDINFAVCLEEVECAKRILIFVLVALHSCTHNYLIITTANKTAQIRSTE